MVWRFMLNLQAVHRSTTQGSSLDESRINSLIFERVRIGSLGASIDPQDALGPDEHDRGAEDIDNGASHSIVLEEAREGDEIAHGGDLEGARGSGSPDDPEENTFSAAYTLPTPS